MKRLIVGISLAAISTGAMAEWTEVADHAEFTHYVNLATTRQAGDRVRMWELMDYKKAQGYAGKKHLSMKGLDEYDCIEGKWRVLALLSLSGRMGKGTVVYSGRDLDGKWGAVPPGSTGETLWKLACGKP